VAHITGVKIYLHLLTNADAKNRLVSSTNK